MDSGSSQPDVADQVIKGRVSWRLVLGLLLVSMAVGRYAWNALHVTDDERLLHVPLKPVHVIDNLRESRILPAKPSSLAGCNVLLISLDTTRADRLGCYGNGDIETPNLDRLANNGIIFSHAIAVAPTTLPSHTTILTGLYPCHHGARVNGYSRLEGRFQTLAEILLERGYACGAAVSAFVLDDRFGLGQGFDFYNDDLGDERRVGSFRHKERVGGRTTEVAARWIRQAADSPFFMWVHYFDPHASYAPAEPYASKYISNPYDGEIAYVDQQIGRLTTVLDELGVSENTLIVVVGDHGEALGYHGEWSHGFLVYDSTLNIPLIMQCPGRMDEGVNVSRRVSQVDVMPTILSLLGVAVPDGLDGIDLTQAESSPRRRLFVENYHAFLEHGWSPLFAVYEGDYKYIHGPKPELYNIELDPLEQSDLAASNPDLGGRMRSYLTDMYSQEVDSPHLELADVQLSPEDMEKLAALGYVGNAGNVPTADRPRPDPKEMLPVFTRCEMALYYDMPRGNVQKAIDTLKQVIAEHPDFHSAYRYLALVYTDVGEVSKAEECLRDWVASRPESISARWALADSCAAQGRSLEAIRVYESILEDDPNHYASWFQLGVLCGRTGDYAGAADHLRRAFELDPAADKCAQSMVEAYKAADRMAELPSILKPALTKHPQSFPVRSAWAQYNVETEKFDEALSILRKGVELSPNGRDENASLALFLAQCPDPGIRSNLEAAGVMERFCEKDGYQDAVALYWLGAVYAVTDRLDEGITITDRARSLAIDAGDKKTVDSCDLLLQQLRQAEASKSEVSGVRSPQ